MDLNLHGKRVVITGGTRGIGLACVLEFLAEGAEVHIVGRSTASLDKAKLPENSGHHFHAADLSNLDDLSRIGTLVKQVDVLVNNAGSIPGGGFASVDAKTWRSAWDLKVYGYIELTRSALEGMFDRGSGVVVNVIGIFGSKPSYDYLCGSTANAALAAFTKAAGAESTKHGARVVGVNPGATRTERLEKLCRDRATERFGSPERWKELAENLPFNRFAEPREIADLVVFLSSDRASYISGEVIDIDGGRIHRS